MRNRLIFILVFGMILLPTQIAFGMFVRLPGGWSADIRLCADGYVVSGAGILKSGVTTVVEVLSSTLPAETGIVFAATGPKVVHRSRVFKWDELQEVGATVELTLDRLENGRSLTSGDGRSDVGVISNCVLFPENAPLYDNPLIIDDYPDPRDCGTVRVLPNETLGQIAARYGVRIRVLAEANGIIDYNLIYAGSLLTVPCGS